MPFMNMVNCPERIDLCAVAMVVIAGNKWRGEKGVDEPWLQALAPYASKLARYPYITLRHRSSFRCDHFFFHYYSVQACALVLTFRIPRGSSFPPPPPQGHLSTAQIRAA